MVDNNKRRHYFVASVEIIYLRDKIERSRRVNVMAVQDSLNITRAMLGTMQQQAQVNVMQQKGPRNMEVTDVVFVNIMHLGHMTNAEFHEGFPEAMSQTNEDGEVLSGSDEEEETRG